MQDSIAQQSAAWYLPEQHATAQYSTRRCRALRCGTGQHGSAGHRTTVWWDALRIMPCTAPPCPACGSSTAHSVAQYMAVRTSALLHKPPCPQGIHPHIAHTIACNPAPQKLGHSGLSSSTTSPCVTAYKRLPWVLRSLLGVTTGSSSCSCSVGLHLGAIDQPTLLQP